jgi:hypothetical protein
MKLLAASRTGSLVALSAVLLAACAGEQQLAAGPAPIPTTSVEQAARRLAVVERERAVIEARYTERERACYQKFFVNHCLDDAKERRRSALAAQRAIEIEAEHFQRQAKVEERDRAMAEAAAQFQAEEARRAAEPPPAPREPSEAPPPPKPKPLADRMARHNAKLKADQAREQAEADKRAANVRAYEERKRESEERQRKVAERKAEKAREAKEKGQVPPAEQSKSGQ